MKRLIILLTLLLTSCSTIKYIPVKGEDIYHTEYITKDSIVYTPVEVIKEVAPELDTLYMETSVAKAKAYLDTNLNTLKGEMKNKKEIIYKDKIVYRDSIIIQKQEVPVEIEVEKKVVPNWVYYSLGLNILILSFFLGRLYFRFRLKRTKLF
mgnify:CR=1 FL=1